MRKIKEAKKTKADVLLVLSLILHGLNWECDLKHFPIPVSQRTVAE